MRTNKALFKGFENADSETIGKLAGYISHDNDGVKERVFQKSLNKYAQSTQSGSMGVHKNIAHITNVTVAKRTGRAVKLALSGVAAACAVAVGVAVVRPMLKGPDNVNNGYTVNNGTETQRELRTAVSPDKATKEDIFWLMMNSIFYYDKVSGKITWSADIDEEDMDTEQTQVDFQCSLSEDKGYVKTHELKMNIKKACDSNHQWSEAEIFRDMGTNVCYYDGNRVIKQDNDSKETDTTINSYHKSIFDIEPVPDSERIKHEENENGRKVLKSDAYYPDPTPEMGLCVLFPQEFAGHNLYDIDKWSLSKNETVSGRECYHLVLPIVQVPNIARYDIWVDVKTGVVMKAQTSDSNENIVGISLVTEIHYEDEAEPVTPMPEDIRNALDAIIYSEDERYEKEIKKVEEDMLKCQLNELLCHEDGLSELKSKFPVCSVVTNLNDSAGYFTVYMYDMSKTDDIIKYLKDKIGNFDESIIEFRKAVTGEDKDTFTDIAEASKEDIFSLMMNSIFNYDKVSGKYFVGSRTADKIDGATGEVFSSDMNDSRAYSYTYGIDISDDSSIEAIVKACRDQPILEEYDVSYAEDGIGVYIWSDNDDDFGWNTTISKSDIKEVSPEERRKVSADGKSCEVIMYPDPTNAGLARESIFPQQYAVNRLSLFNMWENLGFEDVDDRECYHLSGKTGIGSNETVLDENGKVETEDAVRFDMWVDVSTGIIVKYAEYNKDGKICRFMYTTDLKFDDEAEPVKSMPDKTKKKAIENKNDPNSKFQDADLSNHAERRQQRRI